MKLRYLILSVFFYPLLSCGEKLQEAVIEVSEEVPEVVDPEIKARVEAIMGVGFPVLNNDNCVEFLSEWGRDATERFVTMKTKHGDIVLELFNDVPIHKSNLLYKIFRQYYSPSEFIRVVPDFVIQGGNSEEERPQQMRFLIGHHTLPSEFSPNHIHLRGALAMSRSYSNNPDKRSSAYDFYIVTGRKISNIEIAAVEREKGIRYSAEQKIKYREIGGVIHLDGEHTVFGRVISGMDVVDKLASTHTDDSDWPVERLEVYMTAFEERP